MQKIEEQRERKLPSQAAGGVGAGRVKNVKVRTGKVEGDDVSSESLGFNLHKRM